MRKTWIIACAAAAVALAGCNRETQGPVAVGNVFRASIETPSRVAFSDEGAFSWQAGDAVAVSTNAGFKTFTLKEGAGASVAAFDGDLAGVTSATVAVYPASIAKADATVTLPAEYAWTEGQTNAAMYCDAVDLTKVNSFKHLGGIIKVSFAEIPAEADAMVLKAEAKITGDFAIADGKIAAGVGTDEVKVTFTAGSNPAAFYIPVPTGEYKFAVELQAAGVTLLDRPMSETRGKGTIRFVPEDIYTLDLDTTASVYKKQLEALNGRKDSLSADDAARIRALEFELERLDAIREARKEFTADDIQIVLTHTPLTEDYVNSVMSWTEKDMVYSIRYANLVLAGHYNGGQWRLPGKGAIYVPEMGWFPEDSRIMGLSWLGNIPQYISPGLGSDPHYENMPGRVYNPPVITKIILTRKSTN